MFLYFSVIGALIGKQKGRSLEIMNSFELVFNVIEERDIVIDRDYYNTKEEQCMKQENN
jgi:COP9 signalosome complex subunit 6